MGGRRGKMIGSGSVVRFQAYSKGNALVKHSKSLRPVFTWYPEVML